MIFILVLLNISFAQNFEKVEFEPHHIDHINKGCPTNSTCSPKQGELRDKLITILKSKNNKRLQRFFSKNGTLISALKVHSGAENEFIIVDSRCPNHRDDKGVAKYSIASWFDKKINDHEKLFISKIYLENGNEVTQIPIPYGQFPVALVGNEVYFSMGIDGLYYGLQINPKGELRIVNTKIVKNLPEKINCTAVLKKHAQSLKLPNGLIEQFYCRKIWNTKANSYTNVLLAHSCL